MPDSFSKQSWLIQGPHGPLRGDVFLPSQDMGCSVVLGCHGFKGFKDWGFWPVFGRYLAERGIALITFNFSGSGVGDQGGQFTELDRFEGDTVSKSLDDLGTVIGAACSRELPLGGADVRRLGILGHSRGGGLAILRASRDPRVRALVAWAAVSDFHRYTEEQVASWREQGFLQVVNSRTGQILKLGLDYLDDLEENGDLLSPTAAIRSLEVPCLLIHGSRDETVSPDDAQRLQRASAPGTSALEIIPGAGHTFEAQHPMAQTPRETDLLFQKTAAFFQANLAD